MRNLMSLCGVVHHLLISPLSELRVSWVVVRILGVQLALGRVTMELVGLLMMVLIVRGVKLLLGMWGCPSGLLLLYGVWVGRLPDLGGRGGMIVGGGRPLPGHSAVDNI